MAIDPRRRQVPSRYDDKLTVRQQKFVEEFFKDPNSVSRAAIKAGYSKKSANSIGKNLLKNPKVDEALKELEEVRKHELGVSEMRILQELSRIAFADMGTMLKEDPVTGEVTFNLNDLTPDQTAALQEYSKGRGGQRIKLNDKMTALIQIGKYLGMFREQVEVKNKISLEDLVMSSMTVTQTTPDSDDVKSISMTKLESQSVP